MSTALDHALRLADEMAGLRVRRAWRGVGAMITLDLGDLLEDRKRGERCIWVTGAAWRIERGGLFVANSVASPNEEIDEALAPLVGTTVRSVTVHEWGGLTVVGDDWSLMAYPIRDEIDDWVLFDDTEYSAFCGPHGRFGSDPPPSSV